MASLPGGEMTVNRKTFPNNKRDALSISTVMLAVRETACDLKHQ